jgi:DNA polymerase, archaea type
MDNRLIYGKNQINRIVSIEPENETTSLFVQSLDGTIKEQKVPTRYWIVANEKIDNKSVRLKGDLHYCWGNQFSSRQAFYGFKQRNRQKDLFSVFEPKEATMLKDGYTYFSELNPEDVSIFSFDLETTGLDPNASDAQILLISTIYRDKNRIIKRLFAYDDFDNEAHMLESFCSYVREVDPSIFIGHNIFGYDFTYMLGRAENLLIQLFLGRNGSEPQVESFTSAFRVDGTRDLHYKKIRIYGREIVDTMFLAYKYDIGKKYESYGLKKIIQQEGLEKKDRVFYDASQIRFKYKDPTEWDKIKQYCEDDAEDALALYDLMIPPFWYMARAIPKPFQSIMYSASGSQINAMMIRSYLQEGHSLPKASESAPFEGAISLGNPGIYKNVFKVDVASLYPSIMLEYNVHDKAKDPQQNFTKILKYFTEHRLLHKRLYKETGLKVHDDEQAAAKIFINSAYGFMGAPGLLFNSPLNAGFVTKKGREILTTAIEWATGEQFVPEVKEDEEIEE